MRFIIIVLLYSIGCCSLSAQNYMAFFPDSVKKGANSIVRKYDTNINICNAEKIVTQKHYVVTVLNKFGKQASVFNEYYDSFRKINKVECRMYNALGKKIKTIKGRQIKDIGITSQSAMIDDYRMKYLSPQSNTYPYTVEYIYEIESSSTMHIPTWMPQRYSDSFIESASLTISSPNEIAIKFKEVAIPEVVVRVNDNKQTSYAWRLNNIPTLITEDFAPHYTDYQPTIRLAARNFSIDGYQGKTSSWCDLGLWISQLNHERTVLPKETVQKVGDLISGVTNKKEQIRILYQYMQSKTRYIGIQLGIGGWQPFEAAEVDEKGYGDCKALSNYMKALLEAANIASYYTLVYAGESVPDIIDDFPSMQFNHVILSVPLKKDTVWLECTSNIMPFNFLGNFTQNRKVLMVKETGGELVRTPKYSYHQNRCVTIANININANGTAKTDATTTYEGLEFDNLIFVLNDDKGAQKKYFLEHDVFKNIEIQNFNLKQHTRSFPLAEYSRTIIQKNIITQSGKRVFLTVNSSNKLKSKVVETKHRKYDIQISQGFTHIDSLYYTIPSNYSVEYNIKTADISTPFGTYKTTFEAVGDKWLYVRIFSIKRGRYDKSKYKDFCTFMNAVYNTDNNRMVFINTLLD